MATGQKGYLSMQKKAMQ